MENNGVLDFDSPDPIKVPVRLGGRRFLIVEADTETAVKYRNTGTKSAKMQDGKLVGIDGAADVVPVLLLGCLREVKTIGSADVESPVGVAFVRGLPYRISKPWFDKAKEISKGLEEEDTVESLDEQIKSLTERRDKLAASLPHEGGAAGADVGKSSPTPTTGNST